MKILDEKAYNAVTKFCQNNELLLKPLCGLLQFAVLVPEAKKNIKRARDHWQRRRRRRVG